MDLISAFTYRYPNKRVSILRNPKDNIFQVLVEQYLTPDIVKSLLEDGYEGKSYDYLVRNRIRVRRYFFHSDTMQAISQGFAQHVHLAQEAQVLKQRRENVKTARYTERIMAQAETNTSVAAPKKPRKSK
jgi:hypothetical protein